MFVNQIFSIVVAVSAAAVIHAKNIYVAADGSDSNSGLSQGVPFATIGKAVSESADGDFIFVDNGSYSVTETVIVNKNVSVVGVSGNPEDVIIQPPAGVNTAVGYRLLNVTAAGAVVSGLTVQNGGFGENAPASNVTDPTKSGANLYVSAGTVSNCVLRNAKVTSPLNNELYHSPGVVLNGANALLTDSVVCGNINAQGNPLVPGGGIWSVSGRIVRCQIYGNKSRSLGGGIACQDNESTIIQDCVISNNVSGSIDTSYVGGQGWCCGGGGVFRGTLVNCLIIENIVTDSRQGQYYYGGGAYGGSGLLASTAYNCTVASNKNVSIAKNGKLSVSAVRGDVAIKNNNVKYDSGVLPCTLYNTISYDNFECTANNFATVNETSTSNNIFGVVMINSCTDAANMTNALTGSENNVAGDPLFITVKGFPYAIGKESPCFGNGRASLIPVSLGVHADILGYPRSNSRGNIGCFEGRSPATILIVR